MSEFYSIDSTQVSHREYWWGTRSPLVLLGFLLKWLRVRTPGSTDDPNVDSMHPFVVASLPDAVAGRFAPVAAELAELGFIDPVFHVFEDLATSTTIYWATYRHSSGQHLARIHQRLWGQAKPVDRGTFVVFLTPLTDGTVIGSSAGKPDLATPDTVPMLRRRGLAPRALWAEHQEFVSRRAQAPLQPVVSRDELIAASEAHHVLVRDFHLARGVFKPRSEAEQASASELSERMQVATADGLQHPDVVTEVERLQTNRPGWGNAVGILIVSVVAFVAMGVGGRDWRFTLWLVPILLLHESGHWLAMKIFGYRNLRMFFIPLFGAAVTGRHWNVPGWKKAIVSLAGPVPGILLGTGLTVIGLATQRPWLTEAAFFLMLINGFNLLPVLPLDGGHVLHALLFCRNVWLDLTFRILAVGGLLVLGFAGLGQFFLFLAIVMGLRLPVVFKVGRVTDSLRSSGFNPSVEADDRIPLATADTIAGALKDALPKTSSRELAAHTVSVFETLNARPPGTLGVLGLLGVHGGSVGLVVICGFLLLLDKHGGGLGRFTESVLRQPTETIECNAVEKWPGSDAPLDRAPNLLVAKLADASSAQREFAGLTNRLPATAHLTRFGNSLLLTLPAEDDVARERWFGELQRLDTNSFVVVTNARLTASFMFIAPTASASSNLISELSEYLEVAYLGALLPPWAEPAAVADYERARPPRRTWHQINTNLAATWSSPAIAALERQLIQANKRGAQTEKQALLKKRAETLKEEETAIRDRLLQQGISPELLDLYSRYTNENLTNRQARAALERQIANRLGPLSSDPNRPAKTTARIDVRSGFAHRQGLILEVRYLTFSDAPRGLPAVLDWICRQHASSVRYEIHSPSAARDADDE